MSPSDEQLRRAFAARAAPAVVLVPVVLAMCVIDAGAWPPPGPGADGLRSDHVVRTLDPNCAPWWELATLPRIGEITAKRIVAYREQASAGAKCTCPFPTIDALARVHGIGPKTVARMGPHLAIPPDCAEPR